MKILIAGGAGYIGSVLAPKLFERGYKIDVIDLLWFGNHLPPEISLIQKDIFDLKPKDLEEYEQVIFLAGLSNDPMAEFSPKENFIQNGAGPAYLGYIAKQARVKRFIYAGSCSVYGYTENELYDELSPTVSNYPYGISKLQGEESLLRMQDVAFSVICLRQGTISGYSPRMRFDLVVNTMFKTAIQKKEITVNNPAIWRPILNIKDAIAAYIRSVECDYCVSGVFNIASDNYTVGELADIVKSEVESMLDIHTNLIINHIKDYRNYKVSIQKAINVLSFKPMFDVPDILKDLASHLKTFGDFSDPNYYNIEIFKQLNISK